MKYTNAPADEYGFIIENKILLKYTRWDQAVITIPEGIEEIADGAFAPVKGQDYFTEDKVHQEIQKIVFPKTLRKIGNRAFELCHNIKELHLQAEELEIGESAFNNCGGLQRVQIEVHSCTLGKFSFASTLCRSMHDLAEYQSLHIKANTCIIGDSAFFSLKTLADVTLECDSLFIGDSAFQFCNLTQIDLSHCIHVGHKAFVGCPLQKITLGALLLEQIDNEAFHRCSTPVSAIPQTDIFRHNPKDHVIFIDRNLTSEECLRLFSHGEGDIVYVVMPECIYTSSNDHVAYLQYLLCYGQGNFVSDMLSPLKNASLESLLNLLDWRRFAQWRHKRQPQLHGKALQTQYLEPMLAIAREICNRWKPEYFPTLFDFIGKASLKRHFIALRQLLDWFLAMDVPQASLTDLCRLLGHALHIHYGQTHTLRCVEDLWIVHDTDGAIVDAVGMASVLDLGEETTAVRSYAFTHTKVKSLVIRKDIPMDNYAFENSGVAELWILPSDMDIPNMRFVNMPRLMLVVFMNYAGHLSKGCFLRRKEWEIQDGKRIYTNPIIYVDQGPHITAAVYDFMADYFGGYEPGDATIDIFGNITGSDNPFSIIGSLDFRFQLIYMEGHEFKRKLEQ